MAPEERVTLAVLGVDQGRLERRAGLPRVLGDMLEDLGRDRGDVLELHARQFDTGLLLVAVHHRIAESSLAPEITVDGPLVDLGPFGHGPDGQLLPVADRRAVEELGAGEQDPLTRLGRPFAAEGAVVWAPGSNRRIRRSLLGGAHGAHSAMPASPTSLHRRR